MSTSTKKRIKLILIRSDAKMGMRYEKSLVQTLNKDGFEYFTTFHWKDGTRKVAYRYNRKLIDFLEKYELGYEVVTEESKKD